MASSFAMGSYLWYNEYKFFGGHSNSLTQRFNKNLNRIEFL